MDMRERWRGRGLPSTSEEVASELVRAGRCPCTPASGSLRARLWRWYWRTPGAGAGEGKEEGGAAAAEPRKCREEGGGHGCGGSRGIAPAIGDAVRRGTPRRASKETLGCRGPKVSL